MLRRYSKLRRSGGLLCFDVLATCNLPFHARCRGASNASGRPIPGLSITKKFATMARIQVVAWSGLLLLYGRLLTPLSSGVGLTEIRNDKKQCESARRRFSLPDRHPPQTIARSGSNKCTRA